MSANIIGLYLNPPLNTLVLSVDKKNSLQALVQETGYTVETRDTKLAHAYRIEIHTSHGTLNLFAALNEATVTIKVQTSRAEKRDYFQCVMDNIMRNLPENKVVHVILDYYCTNKKNDEWLGKHAGRLSFNFTCTFASWLNQIEIWFGILSRRTLTRVSLNNVAELKNAIGAFIARHNQNAQPIKWRKPVG